jgi:Rha family phage regulatory protein
MQLAKIEKSTGLTSLEIAEITGKEHKNVMRDIEDEIDKLGEEISQLIFEQSSYTSERGREYKCYNLTRDGVLQLGARYDAKIRFTIIQKMNKLENKFKLPTTLSGALYLAADQAKTIEEQTEVIEILNTKITEDAPKVEFATALEHSKDTILVRELAKMLKQHDILTGEKRLFEYLRNEGYVIKNKGKDYNMPTQRSLDLKIMEIKTSVILDNNCSQRINKTPVVTTKGCKYFINKFSRSTVNII